MKSSQAVLNVKKRVRILLSSVFGPYAQDDEYGSRAINPMELYQNQVTRVQGPFSLRMFHRTFGLMLIQKNIQAPCTLLDFPDRDRFIHELKTQVYDIIGISAILPNIEKVKTMTALIRRYQPQARIVIGGHIAARPDLRDHIDADHIVRGDGVRWFRCFLGEDPDAPIRHPIAHSGFGTRILGHTLRDRPGDTAAILIPSVGCPVGCNFCSTSALFGGKGKFINFYETGDQLYEVMCEIADTLNLHSFFILDENFLLHRKRALGLLERMKQGNKSWALFVFSSARVLQSYKMEELIGLGVSWVWMGLEGEQSRYQKLKGVDTIELVRELQANGIRVLGSSIIGLEDHRPEDMDRIIDYAVSHNTDFHQFMLYTPNPGTPLYAEHESQGTLLPESEFPPADAHGQYRFRHRHPHIKNGDEERFLIQAFERDFAENGPSLARLIKTHLRGWQRHKHHPEARVRERYAREVRPLKDSHAGAVWAMRRYFRKDPAMFARLDRLLGDIYREFGLKTRLIAPVMGLYLYHSLLAEKRRLAQGWTYEPKTFYEKNPAAKALEDSRPIRLPVQPEQTGPQDSALAGKTRLAAEK